MDSGYFGQKIGVNVSISRQIGLPYLPDTWMTIHEQYGDILCFSFVLFVFIFDCMATVNFLWVDLFLFVKLQNGYMNSKMSPEPTTTK